MTRNEIKDDFVRRYCGAKGISVIGLDGEYICGTENPELWAGMLNAFEEVYGSSADLAEGMMMIEIDKEPYYFMRAGNYILYAHTMYEPADNMVLSKGVIEGKTIDDVVTEPRPPTLEKEVEAQSRFWRAGKKPKPEEKPEKQFGDAVDTQHYANCQSQIGYNRRNQPPIKKRKGRHRF